MIDQGSRSFRDSAVTLSHTLGTLPAGPGSVPWNRAVASLSASLAASPCRLRGSGLLPPRRAPRDLGGQCKQAWGCSPKLLVGDTQRRGSGDVCGTSRHSHSLTQPLLAALLPRGSSAYFKARRHLPAGMNHTNCTSTSPTDRVLGRRRKLKIPPSMESDPGPLTVFLRSEQLLPIGVRFSEPKGLRTEY